MGEGRREVPVLLAAVAAAWATSFAGTFQFDDWNVIVGDPRVASPAAWWGSMPGIRPLLKLTFALDRGSGQGLAWFHAVNLAIHAASALLVLALLRGVAVRAGADGPALRSAPLLGAVLFAVHPVQVESVTYLSGRSSSLSGMLALASAVAWAAGRERSGGGDAAPGPARAWPWAVASPLLLAASLGVKEGGVVLPAALLLLEAVDVRRPFRWGRALTGIAPHAAVVAVAAAIWGASPVYGRMLAESARLRGPGENLLTHLDALGWLAGQLVRVDRLVADPALPAATGWSARIAAVALLLALSAGGALASLRRRPALAFGILWFIAWLPPTGWWLPRPDPASERQLYVALVGPAWLAGLWLSPWFVAGGLRRAAVAAGLVALGAVTASRNLVYADEVTFWEDVVAKAPQGARAHANLGFALASRCRIAEAEAALLRALELDPGHVRAAVNLRLLREGAPLGPDVPACPGVSPAAPGSQGPPGLRPPERSPARPEPPG